MSTETRSQHDKNEDAFFFKNISRDLKIPRIYKIINVNDLHSNSANNINKQIA